MKDRGSALHLSGGRKSRKIIEELQAPAIARELNEQMTAADMLDAYEERLKKLERQMKLMDKRMKAVEPQAAEAWADLKRRESIGQ